MRPFARNTLFRTTPAKLASINSPTGLRSTRFPSNTKLMLSQSKCHPPPLTSWIQLSRTTVPLDLMIFVPPLAKLKLR